MSVNFSTIITTYNRKHLISRSIDSALAAGNEHDEIIIVDDGSSDGTGDFLQETYADKITYIYQANAGLSTARNTGIKQANNPYIVFFDDDDEWFSFKLALQRKAFEQDPELLFCFTDFSVVKRSGDFVKHYLFHWGQPLQDWRRILQEKQSLSVNDIDGLDVDSIDAYCGDLYYAQMLDDYILPSTLAYNRALLKEDFLYVDGFDRHQSWLFSSGLARRGKACYLDIDTTIQHAHEGYRLTDVTEIFNYEAKMFVLESEWGKNNKFLEKHGEMFNERLALEAFRLIKACIVYGEYEKAKQYVSKYGHLSTKLQVIKYIPMWVF